ncbi:MAG: hypothetical protein KAS72_05520 [Phycisphaerales bacterium]|nr:hypothetical protein [Phycisphaerales bacterium]
MQPASVIVGAAGAMTESDFTPEDRRLTLTFAEEIVLEADHRLDITIS